MQARTIAGLAVLLAAALLLAPAPADAQIPYVQIYFDPNLQETLSYCPGIGVIDTFYVVAHNLGMWMSTIELSIEFPPPNVLQWIGDVFLNDPLHLGSSPTGITITWPTPQKAFDPLPFLGLAVIWLCDQCQPYDVWFIYARPHPYTGKLQAVRWPDYHLVEALGWESQICKVVRTEETTWGRVKALYR